MKSVYRKILPALLLLQLPMMVFAQTDPGTPCGNDADPLDNGCPLDTYVYLMAFIALAYGVWYLHKNNKLKAI